MNTDLKINDRANSPENEEASSSLEARALTKWSCSACTYQNWPKSSKCIMCGKILLFLSFYKIMYL
jgi:ubiquitin thioesterase ZRANB1